MSALLLVATLVLAQAPQAAAQGKEPRIAVSIEELDGETWCSVRAERGRLLEVLEELALRSGRTLEGAALVSPTAIVSIDLRQRPLPRALAYMLGTAGLRAETRTDVIALRALPRAPAPVEVLQTQAIAAYASAVRAFPEHELAPQALQSRARIEELRGNDGAALASFEQLVESHPASTLVAASLFDAARILMRRREWEVAAQRLMDMLRLESAQALEIPGRLALARCTAMLDRPDQALDMVDALDSFTPAVELDDVQQRRAVRARALVAAARPREALAQLDLLDSAERGPELEREALELRAQALEGVGEHGLASRAWIAVSQRVRGNEVTIALRHAARLALAANDEVAVLLIRGLADGESAELEPLVREARERLQLADMRREGTTPLQRLERAEQLLNGGLGPQAHELLASLLPLRETFDGAALLRHARAYAQTLEQRQGTNAAIAFLRDSLPRLADPEHRRALYLLAGDLYERAERLDEAALAYRGRL